MVEMTEYTCATEELRLPAGAVGALVVDSHEPSRLGLALLLRRQAWVGSCWLAADSEEALALARRHRPDVAVLDVSDTGPLAGAITKRLRRAHPGIEILLGSRCRSSLGAPAASLGAAAFLPAGTPSETIVAAVRSALLSGEAVVPGPAPAAEDPIGLSDRDREILALISTGATNREIAARLHLGPDSVKKAATALYRKLGVRNRTEAAQRAAALLGST
ncbi:MAG TPA: response regulator transcription factor [Solirubrobacterales bacterium]|jgi:DNA-binding NarL/FixJ family response regulator